MQRIKDSFAGVITGIVLLLAGIVLLFWNEGNNVKNIKTVDELSANYIDIANSPVDPANEGKLVALNGRMKIADDTLSDPEFGVSLHAAKLRRVVEMYQWDETEEDDDNRKTYSYDGVWRDYRIDSSSFHDTSHQNPEMPYETTDYDAKDISVGDFKLSGDQIHNFPIMRTSVFWRYKTAIPFRTTKVKPEKPRIRSLKEHMTAAASSHIS